MMMMVMKVKIEAIQWPFYLTAHLVNRPEQVIEVHDNDGVPHGREGAVERVGLSLMDRIIQLEF